jgi:hypothetical protein
VNIGCARKKRIQASSDEELPDPDDQEPPEDERPPDQELEPDEREPELELCEPL